MKKSFIPGPVEISRDILKEMAKPMIYHRSQEFKALLKGIKELFSDLLETKNEILLLTNSATGAMEAAIRSCVQSKVLCIANGEFGRRFYEISKANGKEAELLDFGEGKEIKYPQLMGILRNKNFDAVTIVANETSTGIENDLGALRKIIDSASAETLLLVDGVTAVFGTEIDANKADVLLFGTQKALALPPGIAILIANKKALERAEKNENKGYYFDLTRHKKCNDENLTLATPNLPLLYALLKRLNQIKQQGIDNFIQAHERKAHLVRRWAEKNGFELFVECNYSKTVTVIKNNKGIDVSHIIKKLDEGGYCIANGYGPLKDKTFRIGHMGDITADDTLKMLNEFESLMMEKKDLEIATSKTI